MTVPKGEEEGLWSLAARSSIGWPIVLLRTREVYPKDATETLSIT
ncbi:MAG: hypothetical protein QW186_05060 [Candidatus Bathyarchaeia archaeon]